MDKNKFLKKFGRISESQVALHLESEGFYNLQKIPDTVGGCDFIAFKDGIEYYIEVKTGNSPLSQKQKEMKNRFGNRYIVIRWKGL